MIEANLEEWGILSLMIGYRSFTAALKAMDGYGDDRSAQLINKVRASWESSGQVPDLSHKTAFGLVPLCPGRDEIVNACSGMIDAYDLMRESGERVRPTLRRTVEALFELRALARVQSAGPQNPTPSSPRERILNLSLTELPLTATQVNRLKRGGYTKLRDLHGVPMEAVVGKCGFTEKQVASIDQVIDNFLKVTIKPADFVVWRRLHAFGSAHLGESFSLAEGDFSLVPQDEAYWLSHHVSSVQREATDTYRTTYERIIRDKYYPRYSWTTHSEYGWEYWLDALDNPFELVASEIEDVILSLKRFYEATPAERRRLLKAMNQSCNELISKPSYDDLFTASHPTFAELNFSKKTLKCLNTAEIWDTAELLKHSEPNLRALGLDSKSISEVVDRLRAYDRSLPTDMLQRISMEYQDDEL